MGRSIATHPQWDDFIRDPFAELAGCWRDTRTFLPLKDWRLWLVVRWGLGWIGAYWSSCNRRLCVNVAPFIGVALVLRGGVDPK